MEGGKVVTEQPGNLGARSFSQASPSGPAVTFANPSVFVSLRFPSYLLLPSLSPSPRQYFLLLRLPYPSEARVATFQIDDGITPGSDFYCPR